MWVENYRPETFDEVVGNRDIVEEIRSNVETGNVQHMAFFGPAGIGKTTIAKVIAIELYGTADNSSFKELNASDARGIDVIRDEVKKFAGRKSLDGTFKIVFLDEADSLTSQAQNSLRRIMEEYHESCRFILTGNYPRQLIKPLKSRCSVHKFDPISQPECLKRLEYIYEQEDLTMDHEVLEKLTQIYDGDLRQQIGKLESLSNKDEEIDPDELDAGQEYKKLFNYIVEPNFMGAIRLADRETLNRLFNYIMSNSQIPGRVKAEVSIIFAKYMWRLDRSVDEEIQLNAMVAELIKTLKDHVQ